MVLLAESGLGKTRLVQEFYGWLVDREQGGTDAAAYWPSSLAQDANNLLVNPAEASWDSAAALPFLWWGIRLSNPQGHNQVTTGALAAHVQPFLVPHLEPFHREQRRKQRLVDVAKVGGSVVADAVVDLIPVLGLLKKVGEVGLELKGIHDSWRRDQHVLGAEEDAAGRRASLVEQVVADLAKLFDGPGGRSVPAVIVIDDAQFSVHDPGMVAFVEALVAAMTAESWPLLLLVTHWQREWDLAGAQEASIAAALKRADPALVDVLRLGAVPDLAPALAARLPGLLPSQAKRLLERVGGNPRFLDEVLRLVELQGKGIFVKRDPEGPLTDAGLKELLAASTGLHELIRTRLMQSPEEVQKAVVLAGLQGTEFLGTMIVQTAAALAEDVAALDEAVTVAEEPHAYFAATFPGMRAFVQPIYHEVARQRLGYWYDVDEAEGALAEAVRGTLRANPEMELQQIIALYELAVRLFEHAEEQADRLIAVTGLHWLTHFAESRRDTHALRSLALRQVALLRTVDVRLVPHVVEVLTGADRFLGLFAELEARREVVEALVRVTREAATAAGTVPGNETTGKVGDAGSAQRLAAHVSALMAAADVHDAAGNRTAARACWAAALATAETISAPDESVAVLDVLCALNRRHAAWRLNQMETTEAEQGYRAALMLLDRLSSLQRERSLHAETLAVRLGLAKVFRVTGRAHEAEELLRLALPGARAAALEEPGLATANNLANVLDDLAQVLMLRAGGHTPEATELLEESLTISRGHLELLPGVQWPMQEVAGKLEALALDAARRGSGDEAWELVQEAVTLRRSTPGADQPGPARWNLAVSLYRAGDIAASRSHLEAAIPLLQQALERFRAEAEAGTTGQLEAAYYRLASIVLLAPLEMRRDDHVGARTLLEEAEGLREILPGIIPVERLDPLWRHVAEHWQLVLDHQGEG